MPLLLGLRGFDIYGSFCDGIQSIECNVNGRVWTDGKNFKSSCSKCQDKSENLWSFLPKDKVIKYSNFLNQKDFDQTQYLIDSLKEGEWIDYIEEDIELGKMAKDILRNNYVVGDYTIVKDHELLGKNHLRNLILCKISNQRIIDFINPDRIISNDSFMECGKFGKFLPKERIYPFIHTGQQQLVDDGPMHITTHQ